MDDHQETSTDADSVLDLQALPTTGDATHLGGDSGLSLLLCN